MRKQKVGQRRLTSAQIAAAQTDAVAKIDQVREGLDYATSEKLIAAARQLTQANTLQEILDLQRAGQSAEEVLRWTIDALSARLTPVDPNEPLGQC